MHRRFLAAIGAGLLGLVALAAPAPAQAPPPPPKAWIVVDGGSGAVVAGGNQDAPLPVASVFKVFTALLTVENLLPDTPVVVSARAAGMPARNINLKAGQTWRADDLLHALLLVSANDAAVALAEAIAGSDAGFASLMATTARRLGITDRPVLRDPAGLDDEFSFQGGNRISARDLAIVTRAALAYPEIASIVTMPDYRFNGGDGNGHRLLNHNLLLRMYPGAIGVKTGYTRRAGHCLIAAATRDGRTMIAVVLDAPDTYRSAEALLDQGFATPPAALAALPRLPRVVTGPPPLARTAAGDEGGPVRGPVRHPLAAPRPAASLGAASAGPPWYAGPNGRALAVAVVGGLPAFVILARRRQRLRRGRRRPRPPLVTFE
jgi:serine-type D-Ala-D-Ala carboxypeptidase (penicillin-binding protein 5/6)